MGQPWPLVGRSGELAELVRLVGGALQGRGALALVSGEAGIGKTSLLDALLDHHAGLLAARGWCPGAVETPPYGPWLNLARELVSQTGASLAPLPPPFGTGEPAESAYGLAGNLVDWILAIGRPALLILEDLHWADPGSLELLGYLGLRLQNAPLVLVVTYRAADLRPSDLLWRLQTDLQRSGAVRLALDRLDPAAVRTVVDAAFPGTPAAAPWARRLHERTGGHPMFVRELITAAVRAGTIPGEDDPLPETVQQAIAERLARLSPAGEAALQVAAVVGERFDYDLLARVLPDPGLDGALEEALAQRLIRPEGREGDRFAFDHALVREGVLARPIGLRRRRLHLAVAEALLAAPGVEPDTLAYHLSRAGDPRALEYLLTAMDRALRLGALAQAAHLGEDALARMAPGDPRRPELLLKLGVAVEYGDLERARAYWEVAAAEGDEVVANWARHMLANWLYKQHDLAALERMAEIQAEQERLMADPRFQALELSIMRQRLGYPPIARLRISALAMAGRLEEAERLIEGMQTVPPTPQQQAVFWGFQAGVAMYEGRGREAVERYRQASLEALSRKDYRYAFLFKWNQLKAMLWSMADRPDDLDAVAAETAHLEEEASERSGYRWMPAGYSSLGFWQFVRGDWAAARHNLVAYLRSDPAAEDRTWWRYYAARLLLASGKAEEAERYMAPVSPQHPDGAVRFERISVMNHTMRARIHLARGRVSQARPWVDAARRYVEATGLDSFRPEVELCQALLLRAEGHRGAAAEAVARSLEAATALGDRWHAIEAGRLLGELTGDRARLEAALDLARRCRFPYEEALTLLALGREEAHAILERLGVPVEPEQAPSLADGLTEREAEIIRLVAQGLKDKEIGEQLFIAVKTVQAHLRNIFNKVGVSNRAALTAYAARKGML